MRFVFWLLGYGWSRSRCSASFSLQLSAKEGTQGRQVNLLTRSSHTLPSPHPPSPPDTKCFQPRDHTEIEILSPFHRFIGEVEAGESDLPRVTPLGNADSKPALGESKPHMEPPCCSNNNNNTNNNNYYYNLLVTYSTPELQRMC